MNVLLLLLLPECYIPSNSYFIQEQYKYFSLTELWTIVTLTIVFYIYNYFFLVNQLRLPIGEIKLLLTYLLGIDIYIGMYWCNETYWDIQNDASDDK